MRFAFTFDIAISSIRPIMCKHLKTNRTIKAILIIEYQRHVKKDFVCLNVLFTESGQYSRCLGVEP